MGWVAGERNLALYKDDGRIAGRDPYWVQKALAVTVKMFGRVRL